MLDVAKDVYRGKTKKFQYVTDSLATMTFNLMGDKFGYSEYGVFVSNSSQDLQAVEALKSLTQAALQNDKMSISDVISVYNSGSISDIRNKIEASEKEADEKNMQMQQMQMQQAQQAQAADSEIQMAKLQLEQEKQDREDARNTEDNRTKIEIAKMNNDAKINKV